MDKGKNLSFTIPFLTQGKEGRYVGPPSKKKEFKMVLGQLLASSLFRVGWASPASVAVCQQPGETKSLLGYKPY